MKFSRHNACIVACLRSFGTCKLDVVNGHITELYRSESSIIGHCNNILMLFATEVPTDSDLAALRGELANLAQRWKSGCGFLLCLRADTRPPEPGMRDRIVATLRQMAPRLNALGCVVLGEGFMASAKRSVIAALLLGMRSDHPTKVFSDVGTGVRWLTAQLGGADGSAFDESMLVGKVEEIAVASVPPPPPGLRPT